MCMHSAETVVKDLSLHRFVTLRKSVIVVGFRVINVINECATNVILSTKGLPRHPRYMNKELGHPVSVHIAKNAPPTKRIPMRFPIHLYV